MSETPDAAGSASRGCLAMFLPVWLVTSFFLGALALSEAQKVGYGADWNLWYFVARWAVAMFLVLSVILLAVVLAERVASRRARLARPSTPTRTNLANRDTDSRSGDIAPVVLTVAASRFECEAVTALLRSCGIEVLQGPAGGVRPEIDDNRIYVRREDLADANALLDASVEWPE